MSKVYLISAFNHGDKASRFFHSMEDNLGDNVMAISMQYEHRGKFQQVYVPKNVKIIKVDKEYPGNTGKHKDLRDFFKQYPLPKDAWCIFTDVHDVIFQKPLPKLPKKDGSLILCDEGKLFKEIEFWRMIFPKNILNWPAFNVGCFAARFWLLMAFWDYLYEGWMKFFNWYKKGIIPPINDENEFPFGVPLLKQKIKEDTAKLFNGYFDTLCFNTFILENDLRTELMPDLFACYAFQYEAGLIKKKKGLLYTHDNKLISIAHYNGNTKEWLEGGDNE